MKYFDAHSHAHFPAFENGGKDVAIRARQAEVSFVTVGTRLDTSKGAISYAYENGPGVWASVGLHPVHTSKSFRDKSEAGAGEAQFDPGEVFDRDVYLPLARDPMVVAIGECGLDYYHIVADDDGSEQEKKERQKKAFIAQMELAHEVGKPLMIHCRNAFGDLREMITQNSALLNPIPGILHFFTGTLEDATFLAEKGFYFTFGGVITFARQYDEILRALPMDRILSETDAPYVAPSLYRGKRNESAYVVEVIKSIAHVRGITEADAAAQILDNALRVFSLKK